VIVASDTFAAAAGVGACCQSAEPVGKTRALLLQFVGHPRPFAQFDHQWVIDRKPTEGHTVGAHCAAEHAGVAAVILGACHREAVTETVELLRIDGEDRKAVLEQHLHDRSVRGLDRNRDLSRRGFGLLQQPIAHRRQPGAVMREVALAYLSSFAIKQANAVALRRPVDADEP
jgi:hypothetical protein